MEVPRMNRTNLKKLTFAAVVGAIYAVLTLLLPALSYGPIQFRFAEALCVLPFLFPETVWGLTAGCLVANILSPYGVLDMIFGTLATLIAALITSRIKVKWLAPLPPVLCNGIIVGGLIAWTEAGGFNNKFLPAFLYNGGTVAAGEAVVCFVLGLLLLKAIPGIMKRTKRQA